MDIYASLGFIMTIISWIAGIYMVRNWRGNKAMSISEHAASATNAGRLFAAVLLFGGLIFYFWLITWFTDRLQLPAPFTVLVCLAFTGQIIAALIPDTQGWRRNLHRSAAYTMAALYVPILYCVVQTGHNFATTVTGSLALGYMLFAGLLYVFVKKARAHYLLFQSAYIIAFQCTILVAAYS